MSEEKPRLEGKVAQIVSEREIAINIGSLQGVEKGMKFAVLAPSPQEVKDPETGELLDVIDREKIRVEATEVRERITICATYRTRYIPGGPFSGIPVDPFRPGREVPETLRVSEAPSLPLDPEDSYVKVGDRIIEIRKLPQE